MKIVGAKYTSVADDDIYASQFSLCRGQRTLNFAKRQTPQKALESEKEGAGAKQAENILIPTTGQKAFRMATEANEPANFRSSRSQKLVSPLSIISLQV